MLSELNDSLLAIPVHAIQTARSADAAVFQQLVGPGGRLGWLTATCFLLYHPDDEAAACVHRFVLHTAPVLLQQLNRVTKPQRVMLDDRVRGKIDWSATYKSRASGTVSPTTFICLQSWRQFDQLENQLFKYLLHHIRVCLDQVPASIMSWRVWNNTMHENMTSAAPIGEYLAYLADRVRTFNASVYLQHIALPIAISEQHLAAARTAKNKLYLAVANLYDLYSATVSVPDYESWAAMLSQSLPSPHNAPTAAFGKHNR
jgi:hypothetical protein